MNEEAQALWGYTNGQIQELEMNAYKNVDSDNFQKIAFAFQ